MVYNVCKGYHYVLRDEQYKIGERNTDNSWFWKWVFTYLFTTVHQIIPPPSSLTCKPVNFIAHENDFIFGHGILESKKRTYFSVLYVVYMIIILLWWIYGGSDEKKFGLLYSMCEESPLNRDLKGKVWNVQREFIRRLHFTIYMFSEIVLRFTISAGYKRTAWWERT